MKRMLLGALCAMALQGQSISVTSPTPNQAVSGFIGFFFQVALSSAPSVVQVCYTVDAYPAFHPGIDAPTTLGCSITPPFNYPYNSYWNLNGSHQVVATAYDSLGNVVATSAAVAFSTANTWPVSWAPGMTVTTSTALTSNWSGAVTLTPTITGANAGVDNTAFFAFVDGIQFYGCGIHSNSPVSGTCGTVATPVTAPIVQTTAYPNGPHVVCVEADDQTSSSIPSYSGDIGSTAVGAATEWCRTVTFASSTTPMAALLNAREAWITNSGTFQLGAQILNTDGTTTSCSPTCPGTSAAPVYQMADASPGYLTASGTYNFSQTYGGFGVYIQGPGETFALSLFGNGNASVSSTGLVTGISNGTALVNVMTPTITFSDLTINGSIPSRVLSAAHPFTYLQEGWLLKITGGSGCTVGVYQMGPNVGQVGGGNGQPVGAPSSVCTGTTGPTSQVWIHVQPHNNTPCYNTDGTTSTSWSSKCYFANSGFTMGATILTNEKAYNSANPNCFGAASAVACEFNASGFNTFEFGGAPAQLASIAGTEPASTWTSNFPNFVASVTNQLTYPKFRALVQGSYLLTSSNPPAQGSTVAFWGTLLGNESSPTYIGGSQTATQYAISQYETTPSTIVGIIMGDEISGIYGYNTTQGPLLLSSSGTAQSPFTSIVAVNSGTCALTSVQPSLANPISTFIASNTFIIQGATSSGFNSSPGTTYSIHGTNAGGASATASVSGGVVTVTVAGGASGSNYWVPPAVYLIGGGGTYSSATATVNSATGKVTAVTVVGSSGYINAPNVVFSYNAYNFGCTGVANGTYTSATDPMLRIEPQVAAWMSSNTSYIPYNDWSLFQGQVNGVAGRKLWIEYPGLGIQPNQAFCAWTGCAQTGTAQTLSPAFQPDAADLYVPFASAPYIASRQALNGIFVPQMHGYFLPAMAGYINQDIPQSVLTEWTNGYAGTQGYNPGGGTWSCSGNTLTSSVPHGISNIPMGGGFRLAITGATDNGSPQDSCNNNFWVVAAPTTTTLTVDLAATDFSGTGFGGTATFADATTMSIQSSAGSCQNGPGAVATCISASNSNVPEAYGSSPSRFLPGSFIYPATPSATYYRKRCQTFTIAGATGTAASNFNSKTFRLDCDNLNLSAAPSGQYVYLFYHQVPSMNGSGGTAVAVPNYGVTYGVNGTAALAQLNSQWSLGSFWAGLAYGIGMQRAYKPEQDVNGYNDQGGLTGGGPTGPLFTTWPSATNAGCTACGASAAKVSTQPYAQIVGETHTARSTFEALSLGGVMAQYWTLTGYLMQPKLPSPDAGPFVECFARDGSGSGIGKLVSCWNKTDGVQTPTIPLGPYETSGQSCVRDIVDDHSSTLTILTAGASTDSPALNPAAMATYRCPQTFAGTLSQPNVGVKLSDVSGATSVSALCSYNFYNLALATPQNLGAGSGGLVTAALNMDRNVGPIYCQLSYLGSSNQLLAGGPKSAVIGF